MRILLALLLAVGLGAASPRTPDDNDSVALITAIYKTYAEDKDKDNPGLPHVYSKRLQALIDKDEKETPEGMVGRIDWHVFVDGPDWQLSGLKIALVSKSATTLRYAQRSRISARRVTCSSISCLRTAIGASTTSRRRLSRAGPCRRS